MTTTTSTALGSDFSYDENANGWYEYINNGEYTSEQEEALVGALTNAQVDEFDNLLPDGYHWSIHTSELIYPVGDDAETGDLEGLLEQATETVIARYEEIEAEALAEVTPA